MKGLDNGEKYSLLFNHVQPPVADHLPSTHSQWCNRKFRVHWLAKYPWLKYSPKLDAIFCGPCTVLLGDN